SGGTAISAAGGSVAPASLAAAAVPTVPVRPGGFGLTAAVLAVSVIACLAGIRRGGYRFDAGYILYGPPRVAAGLGPYPDFWGVSPPGQFYVLAALFKLAGSSVLLARLYDAAVRTALLYGVFRLARRGGGALAGLVAVGLALLQVAPSNFYVYPMFPALALVLVSLDRLSQPDRGTRGLFLAGLAAGGPALLRHDACVYSLPA